MLVELFFVAYSYRSSSIEFELSQNSILHLRYYRTDGMAIRCIAE